MGTAVKPAVPVFMIYLQLVSGKRNKRKRGVDNSVDIGTII
jgi:hypothetical protein